ncbi:unnamed protein product [Amoebophrya sp. A120]|nr:unnamed protein product [Amoebophrya sp. A120]|eukprot:GSA120T00001035001.1
MSPFLVGLFAYYICMGSASILVVKFSEASGGKLVYNVAVAVFFIELLKLCAALVFDNMGLCGSTKESRRSTTMAGWVRYAGPAFMYAIQNNLGFYAISLLGPPLFSLFVNSKILFAAVSGWFLLEQHFTKVQWLGLVNLVLALVVSKVRTIGECGLKLRQLMWDEDAAIAMSNASMNPSYFWDRHLHEASVLLDLPPTSGLLDSTSVAASEAGSATSLLQQGGSTGAGRVLSSASSTTSAAAQMLFPDYNLFGESTASSSVWSSPIAAAGTVVAGASNAGAGATSEQYYTVADASAVRLLQAGTSPAGIEPPSAGFGSFVLGMICVTIMSVTSGLSGAVNEWLLKSIDSDVPLMRKNAWTYQWGCIFNLGGAAATYGVMHARSLLRHGAVAFSSADRSREQSASSSSTSTREDSGSIFHGFTWAVGLLVVCECSYGLSVSLILRYFDNVVKCIGGVVIIFVTTFMSWIFFDSEVCPEFVVSVLIFGISSLLYVGDFNAVLKKGINLNVVSSSVLVVHHHANLPRMSFFLHLNLLSFISATASIKKTIIFLFA